MADRRHHVEFDTTDGRANRDNGGVHHSTHREDMREGGSPRWDGFIPDNNQERGTKGGNHGRGQTKGGNNGESGSKGNNSLGDSLKWEDSHGVHVHYKKHQHHGDHWHVPKHIYDRYPHDMDMPSSGRDSGDGRHVNQLSSDVPVDMEHMHTLYIPKHDGGKTLMRRRRTSSKRRSSSRRKHEHHDMAELMNCEDNHLLPSLRLTRKQRTKSLKDRRVELEEEKRQEEEEKAETLHRLLHQWKDAGELSNKRMDRFRRWRREHFSRFSLWITSFKVIEGKHGTAVMSFFMFIRWLFFLNLFLTIVMLCITIVPYLALGTQSFAETLAVNSSRFANQALGCTKNYTDYTDRIFSQKSTFEKVLDFLQGTGWMERTILFYGHYHNYTRLTVEGTTYTYNMNLAYLLAIGTCFFVSAILLIRNSAKTLKTTFGMEKKVAAYTNKVFSGWDYAISDKRSAKVKSRNLFAEFKSGLFEECEKLRRENRTANDRATVYLIRVMVNCCVLALLVGALFLVYFLTDFLLTFQEKDLHEIVTLIMQYLPYLAITVLNFAIPIVFQKIVLLEDYSPHFALNITLTRSVLLRLASLLVLFFTLYRLLISKDSSMADGTDVDEDHRDEGLCGNRLWEVSNTTTARGSIKCWETYVGQQLYKLVLLDLIVEASIVVFVQFPRKLIYDRFSEKVGIVKKIGPQEFDLPQSVIDIIYTQTLCWMGMFFSPLIPLMTFIKCFIFFYLRKWTLLSNCVQTGHTYRTSRSHSLFMFVLLISFILALVIVGYMVSSLPPSQSCGPFRVYSASDYTIFTSVTNVVRSWPVALRDFLLFLSSIAFLVTASVLIILVMYVFCLLGQGYKKREKILSEQLRMVSADKRFLLTRVNEVLAFSDQ